MTRPLPPGLAASETRVQGRARSSVSPHRRRPPSPANTRTRTVPVGYLRSLPQVWGVRGRTGVSAAHLHGAPSPSWTRHSSSGTGVRGRRGPAPSARTPPPPPTALPGAGLWVRRPEQGGRGGVGGKGRYIVCTGSLPARDLAPARLAPPLWQGRSPLRTPHWPAAWPMGGCLQGLLPLSHPETRPRTGS